MSHHTKVLHALRSVVPAALAVVILAALPACQSTRPLRPFTTDGCSCWPDGPASKPDAWHSACVIHDVAYWRGGTYGERLAADRKLRDDVAARGFPRMSRWMFCGVRLGGSPWFPLKSRWGYGWPWGRGYRTLSEVERANAAALLPKPAVTGFFTSAQTLGTTPPDMRLKWPAPVPAQER